MNDQMTDKNYSFCPKCGALMKNGVCSSCAGGRDSGVYSAQRCQQGAWNIPNTPRKRKDHSYLMTEKGIRQKKKGKAGLIAGIIAAAVILIMIVVGSFFYGRMIGIMANGLEDGNLFEDWDFPDDRENDFDDAHAHGKSAYDDENDDSYGGEGYVPSPEDEYYYGPCDAVNEDVSYEIVPQTYERSEVDSAVVIEVNYYQLKGDNIPNLDKLNEAIENTCLYYAEDFLEDTGFAEYGESYYAFIDAYVTYNDEEIVSIVLDESISIDNASYIDLYAINIDLKNGVILDNTSLVGIDEEFAAELRMRSDEQNGHIDYLDEISDQEILEKLRDKNAMIAYFTPLGMEIGLNYNEEGYGGWFTATYKDYEDYIDKF